MQSMNIKKAMEEKSVLPDFMKDLTLAAASMLLAQCQCSIRFHLHCSRMLGSSTDA